MKKTFYFVLALIAGLASCDKKDVIPPQQELPTITTMNRSFDFVVRGTKRDTAYTNADVISTGAIHHEETTLGVKSNVLSLFFNAGPHVNGTAGDNITFQIEKSILKAGYIGTYSVGTQALAPLKTIRYLYGKKSATGGFQAYIMDNTMGSQLNGSIEITAYDAKRQTLSGSYSMTANLTYDPTDHKVGYYPDDKCDVTLTGTFANVKIKNN